MAVNELRSEIHRELEHSSKDVRPVPAPAGPASSDVVRLNVGGTQFTTSRTTLTSVKGSMLDSMFSGRYKASFFDHSNL